MKKFLFAALVSLLIIPTYATKIMPKKLSELVKESDHVLIVKIEKITMIDGNGKEIKNLDARTGPGLKNQIQYHVVVEKNGVLKTNAKKSPQKLIVGLWRMWHSSLGSHQDMKDKKVIMLLKGKNFERVYHGGFIRNLDEKKKIEQLLVQKNKAQK
ncbi:hypothetical protein [Candidatus Uabimicrobium amorphum]|uniref:Uncharacterized protein n=1 Tax=Uabimicrobium amorphum TaxID=2596890 RepID=A0A5S9IQW4_UABAM|nr:hypothetical protein [Candidatus Uabimicrobium amorphum]BBM85520.1 hypothetical protein UABAM_03889 [Candidatus Uabimicrobium amorphum]